MTLIYKYIFAHTKEITRRKTHLKIHSKAFSQKSDPLQYAAVQYDLLFIYEHTSRACLQLNGMAAEKRGLCLSGKSVNMQLFLKDSHGL